MVEAAGIHGWGEESARLSVTYRPEKLGQNRRFSEAGVEACDARLGDCVQEQLATYKSLGNPGRNNGFWKLGYLCS